MIEPIILFNFDDIYAFFDTILENVFGYLGAICILLFVGGLIYSLFSKGNKGLKTTLCALLGAILCSVLNWAIYGELLPLPPVLNDIIRALLGI
jgi:hypothetical protein